MSYPSGRASRLGKTRGRGRDAARLGATRTFTVGRELWLGLLIGAAVVLSASGYEWSQERLNGRQVAFVATLVLATFAWARTLRMELSAAGVRYRSGLRSRSLAWTEIGLVSLRWGSRPSDDQQGPAVGAAFLFASRDPRRPDIRFLPIYFSRRDCVTMKDLAEAHLRAARTAPPPP
jgi:hypothetical protein